MNKDISRRSTLGGMAMALAAPAVLGSGSAWAQGGGTIRFGGSLGMSGRYAETGLNIRHGYETAIKFINEQKGGAEIGGQEVSPGARRR